MDRKEQSLSSLSMLMNYPEQIFFLTKLLREYAECVRISLMNRFRTWKNLTKVAGVSISAAPILHRCPTVGYVFDEPDSSSTNVTPQTFNALERNAAALEAEHGIKNPKSLLSKLIKARQPVHLPDGTLLEPPELDVHGRKVVILGDTYDASAGLDFDPAVTDSSHKTTETIRGMAALAQDADVIVHECTNAALPGNLLSGVHRVDERQEEVRVKALLRGHSTPKVAGSFAARLGARQLLLNHFSIKYPAPAVRTEWNMAHEQTQSPRNEQERKWHVMREIERQASEAWHDGLQRRPCIHRASALQRKAIASYDGFTYRVPLRTEPDQRNSDINTDQRETSAPRSNGPPESRNAPRRRRGADRGTHRGRGRGVRPSREAQGEDT